MINGIPMLIRNNMKISYKKIASCQWSMWVKHTCDSYEKSKRNSLIKKKHKKLKTELLVLTLGVPQVKSNNGSCTQRVRRERVNKPDLHIDR